MFATSKATGPHDPEAKWTASSEPSIQHSESQSSMRGAMDSAGSCCVFESLQSYSNQGGSMVDAGATSNGVSHTHSIATVGHPEHPVRCEAPATLPAQTGHPFSLPLDTAVLPDTDVSDAQRLPVRAPLSASNLSLQRHMTGNGYGHRGESPHLSKRLEQLSMPSRDGQRVPVAQPNYGRLLKFTEEEEEEGLVRARRLQSLRAPSRQKRNYTVPGPDRHLNRLAEPRRVAEKVPDPVNGPTRTHSRPPTPAVSASTKAVPAKPMPASNCSVHGKFTTRSSPREVDTTLQKPPYKPTLNQSNISTRPAARVHRYGADHNATLASLAQMKPNTYGGLTRITPVIPEANQVSESQYRGRVIPPPAWEDIRACRPVSATPTRPRVRSVPPYVRRTPAQDHQHAHRDPVKVIISTPVGAETGKPPLVIRAKRFVPRPEDEGSDAVEAAPVVEPPPSPVYAVQRRSASCGVPRQTNHAPASLSVPPPVDQIAHIGKHIPPTVVVAKPASRKAM